MALCISTAAVCGLSLTSSSKLSASSQKKALPLCLPSARPFRLVVSALKRDQEADVSTHYDSESFFAKAFLSSSVFLTPLLADQNVAHAVGGELGILEGTSFALLHPIIMGSLLLTTLYAGFLGWQWRRQRTLGDEISELKKQLAPAAEGAAPSPLEAQIEGLTQERKELSKGGYREKHYNVGSLLLASGVFIAVEGCVNTFLRTGKLFPGPHLFAGAGIVVLWALAAGLVPAMQKGDNNARNAHIALNSLNVLLFLWQVPTGLEIVDKVFQFTSWP